MVGSNLITIGDENIPGTTTTLGTATLSDGDKVQITGAVQEIQTRAEYSTEVRPW